MAASRRFAVAVHTLVALGYLRKQGVERVSSHLIAKSVNTNPVVIRNLLRSLKEAGLVESKEGKNGGVCLARPPKEISLLMIYAAVEDTGLLGLTKNAVYKPCPVSREMKRILPPIFAEVDQAVSNTLRGRTLKSLIDDIH